MAAPVHRSMGTPGKAAAIRPRNRRLEKIFSDMGKSFFILREFSNFHPTRCHPETSDSYQYFKNL
jgi:hypothetical protein